MFFIQVKIGYGNAMAFSNFHTEERHRKNSLIYVSNGYRYAKNRESDVSIYLRCMLYKSFSCKAAAIIETGSDVMKISSVHNHGLDDYQTEILILKNKIKKAVEGDEGKLRQAFDQTCRHENMANQVSFRSMASTLYKRRRMTMPKIPVNATEFAELLPQSPYWDFDHEVCREGDVVYAVLFYVPEVLEKLKNCKIVHFDGTFFTVPRIFSQLFTLFINEKGHAVPAVHVLMLTNRREHYIGVFTKIATMCPEFNPDLAISDYEKVCERLSNWYIPI